MKAERQKAGIVSRAASLLTHNWGLKLLALVLATIAYHSLKTERLSLGTESLNRAADQGRAAEQGDAEDMNRTVKPKAKGQNDRQPLQHR